MASIQHCIFLNDCQKHKTSSINCQITWRLCCSCSGSPHMPYIVQFVHTHMHVFVYHFTSSSRTILHSWVFALLLPTVTEPPSKILCQAIARVYVNAATHALCRYCVQWCRTCGCVITCGLGTYIPCYIYRYVACSTNGYCKYVGEVSASWCWQHVRMYYKLR